MALRDYILCKYCECKIVYDGYDDVRDSLEQTYGTSQLACPDCLKKLEEIIRESEQKIKESQQGNISSETKHMVIDLCELLINGYHAVIDMNKVKELRERMGAL